MKLSVIIPIYNEASVVDVFLPRLRQDLACVRDVAVSYILVDDGSSDGTYLVLKKMSANMPDVTIIRLFMNCGHQKALIEGMRHANGNAVLMLDGDGQHPAAVARLLVERWVAEPEHDIIQAVREGGQSGTKDWTSRLFYALVRYLVPHIEIEPGESDFRVLSPDLVRLVLRARHGQRNLRVFLGMLAANKTRITYEAAPRLGGRSKYTFRKMIRLAIDGLFGFSYLPLRVSHWISAFLGVVSLAVLIQSLVVWAGGGTVPGWTSIVGVLCLCFCGVFAVLAIQSEYLIMIYESLHDSGTDDFTDEQERKH